MSMPTIPNIEPDVDIDEKDAVNLLLASIAEEELGLAHIINAEAEKIQSVLGTLKKHDHDNDDDDDEEEPSIDDLLAINKSVEKALRKVIDEEILLQFKLEDVGDLTTTTTATTTTTTTTTTETTTETTTSTTTTTTTTTKKDDDDDIKVSAGCSDTSYIGNGSNRVGSTTVTLTFTLADSSTVKKTETFSDINETTSEEFNYTIGGYDVTVEVTVIVEGKNNNMYIIDATAVITEIA